MKSEILFNNGNTEEADAIMKQILRIAVQQKNFQYMANAYHLLTAYNMKSYGFQKAYFCGRKAVSYYERMGTRQTSEANVIKIMSLTELLRNNVAESSRLVERLSGKPFAHYIDAIEARAERYLLTGEYRQAADLLEYSLGKLGESRDDHWFAVHSLLSLAYWQLCDFEKIKSTARRLLSAGGRHYSNISQLHANLAVACHFTDEPERVAENIQQAEFYAYQIRNDFDLIDALRSLAVALLTLGDTEKAAALAQEGLTIGLRHSAFYPAFSLLMVLAEIHYNRGETENCRFFLEEAAFSIELNPLLPTRDIMLYHYLRYLTEPGEKRMDYLETAYGLFEHEKAELGNPGLVSNFLAMRCFSKIQKDIAVAHGNSSSEGGAR
jgi:tetratricopeptide (TPR) repeat protein